jgi:hypothetical protein
MGESSERVEAALAAYLEFLEMGGTEPDTRHLSFSEQEELQSLIDALEMTEGVAFGLGRREESGAEVAPAVAPPPEIGRPPRPALSEKLVSELRNVLPFDVHIDPDVASSVSQRQVGGIAILDHWLIGTFGGRVRLWLIDIESAADIEKNRAALDDLKRVFGAFPDTAAIALVAKDMTCLLIEPEDCAPQIRVPGGSLVPRHYRRPVQPAPESVRGFLNELVPYWDPIPVFERDAGLTIDVADLSDQVARGAIEEQRAVGQRAREGNPKKEALLSLGEREIAGLKRLATGLLDASVKPEEIEARLGRLAKNR